MIRVQKAVVQGRWRIRIKCLLCGLCWLLGFVKLAAWANRSRVIILCYHGVTGRKCRDPEADPHGLHVRRSTFGRQLAYLKRHYRLIPLTDYLEARRNCLKLPPYTAVVTFDDGYRNFLTLAAPLLTSWAIPVTVYLITGRLPSGTDIDSPPAWVPEDDRRFLSEKEVLFLQRGSGITFGSHTRSHTRLDVLDEEAIAQELQSSFLTVRNLVSEPNHLTLAYPFGFSSKAIAEQTRATGFVGALTTDPGANDDTIDLFSLRRVLIGDDDLLPLFAARVSGLLWMLKNSETMLRDWLRRGA